MSENSRSQIGYHIVTWVLCLIIIIIVFPLRCSNPLPIYEEQVDGYNTDSIDMVIEQRMKEIHADTAYQELEINRADSIISSFKK